MADYCNSEHRSINGRGTALIYAAVSLLPLLAVATLCVDLGRVQTAKCELQAATDAAARYAAAGMNSMMLGTSGAIANATSSFADNHVDGQPIAFDPSTDLQLGIWTSSTRTFTPTTVAGGANAVMLTTHVTLGSGTHTLPFLSIFHRTVNVTAKSVATINGQDSTTLVSSQGNPWLSGMPAGTCCTDFRTNSAEWDYSGGASNLQSSPAEVPLSGLGVSAGESVTFDGVTGGTDYTGNSVNSDADGLSGSCVNLGSSGMNTYENSTTPINGMSNCHAPINSMMAVFLTDADPSASAAPPPLDFTTAASRDYVSLQPQVKQVFFIGDGRRANGEIQQITVPSGATRLIIANMDGWQYCNNIGGYTLTIHAVHKVTTVLLR